MAIRPTDIINKLSVENLCENAEKYFSRIPDPTPLMAKPFISLTEGPILLYNLGLLLSGMRLGKSMKILDFGAGSCWLSKFLNQLQCSTVSLDTSITALDIGKILFKEYPIVGKSVTEPIFLHFDGHNIELPNESVDRIICFDSFHHIPNQREILSEFIRVLKTGGIVGFSEPGRHHSQSLQAQYEMLNYGVLENDIELEDIFRMSKEVGFTGFSCKLLGNYSLELSYEDYKKIIRSKYIPSLSIGMKFWRNICTSMIDANIFFLHKGTFIPDSRENIGLSHTIKVESHGHTAKLGKPIAIAVEIKNTGDAKWLNSNISDIGVVKLGAHLYDDNNKLIDLDFFRSNFEKPVLPGETVNKNMDIILHSRGRYNLIIDLVSEYVCWFENIGSKPISIQISVE